MSSVEKTVYFSLLAQGLFSPFWDNDPYPCNWEFKRENAQIGNF